MPRAFPSRLAPAPALALILAGAAAGPAAAQPLSGAALSATLSQRLEADTNYNLDDPSPGTSYFTDTRFAADLLSQSDSQIFELGFDTGLRALWEAEEDFEFTFASPTTANVGYARDWAGAAFDSDFSWRAAEVDFTRTIFIDADGGGVPDDLTQLDADSTEYRSDASVDLELATDAPSSYALSFDATNFDYSVVTPDQVPRTTYDGSALWTLQLNPILSGALLGTVFYYDGEDDESTTLRVAEIDAGVIYQASPSLELAAGLGYAERRRRETVDGDRQTTEDETGPTARFGVNYDFEDFQVFGDGRVTTAAPKTRFLGGLTVIYPLPRGSINARAFQTYFGDSSSNEARFTAVSVGFEHEINTVSSFGFDITAGQQASQDFPEQPDVERLDATIVYTYALTELLAADFGYRYSRRREDPADATGNAFFVELGRTFETRR